MSQNIKLIRSNVSGKKPDKFNLNVGELALNTADGLFYFKRGDDTVQTLVSTNAVIRDNVLISGDFYLTGSSEFSGSVLTIGNSSFSGSINVSSSATFRGPINLYPTEAPATGEYSASFYVTSSTNDLWIADHSSSFDFTSFSSTLKSGILTGGVVSTGSSNTVFNITSGSGQIIDINKDGIYGKPHPTIKYVEWDTFTDQSLTYLSTQETTWLLIDSDGNLVQQPTTFIDDQYKTHILIGAVIHPNKTSIALTKTFPVVSYGSAQQFEDFIRIFGPIKVEGYDLSASGSSLSVNRASGRAFSLGRNYLINPEQPNIISDGPKEKALFYRYYRSGSGFKTDNNAGAGYDVVDPTNYDDGTGTLAAVPGGQYTIQRIFYFPGQENLLGIYYGRDTYNSLATAEDGINEEPFSEIDNTRLQAILVGYLLVKSGATDLSNTADAKFIQAGLFRDTGTSGGGGGGGAGLLDDLTDVTISAVTTGDLLSYTGAGWENVTDLEGNYTITGSLGVTGSISTTGITIGGTAVTASFSAGNGLALSGTTFSLNTGSNHFIFGSRKQISVSDTTGASGINLDYNQSTGVISGSLLTSSIYIGAGNGLTGDGSVSLGSSASLAVGAGTGITVNSNDVQLKNAGSLTGNKVLKWDSGNNQLTNSTITDDGTNVSLTGDLTVAGTLTAQEFYSEFVSSSIIYESGSTKFGDTSDDTHERTGSLNISGSVDTTGNLYVGGNAIIDGVIEIDPSGSTGRLGVNTQVTSNDAISIVHQDSSGGVINAKNDVDTYGTFINLLTDVYDGATNFDFISIGVNNSSRASDPKDGVLYMYHDNDWNIWANNTKILKINSAGLSLLQGHITSSGNISSSADIFAASIDVTGNADANTFSIDGSTVIDASENITGTSLDVSGEVEGNTFAVDGTTVITAGRAIENITQADIDNIRIDGNTISNTATDQNVTIEATGTGILDVNVGSNFQNLITVQDDIYPETNYTSNIGAINKKFLTLNVAELIVETLVASERRSTVGGRFNVGISTQLSQSLASGSTTIIVENNNLNSGDIIHLEGGVLPKVEFMEVTSTGSATSGDGYSYTVTRDLDGSGANDWDAGSGVFNTGQIGNGFIDQYAINSLTSGSGVNTAGPTIAFMERTGSLYPDIDIRAGVGNLKGWYGYTTESFGFAAGDYKGQNITVDPENGLRIRNTNTLQFQASGSTLTIGDNFIFNSSTGLLKVSGSNVQLETPAFFLGGTSQFVSGSGGNIEISSSNFHLLNGNITASNVDLSGNITATTGNIGGFAITNDAITGSSFYLSGSATGTQFFISASNFNVKANGQLTASAAFIGGTSKIAGFTVSDTQINSGTDLVLKSNGQITGSNVLFTGGKISGSAIEFDVTNFTAKGNSVEISGSNFHLLNGNITASNVDLSGNITATTGNIGGFAITSDAITGSSFYLSGSATGDQFFISASNFNVKANGNLTASNAQISGDITATTGNIGGFSITTSAITGSSFYLSGSATGDQFFISASNFNVKANGNLTASNAQISGDITATSGQIAGFTISGDVIAGVSYSIDASAGAEGEYFISSSDVKIEGNGDAVFGEYTFSKFNDENNLNGLTRNSDSTNIKILEGRDANGNGALLAINAQGDFYIAPISSSILSGSGWNGFTRELKYSLANDRWEIEQNTYIDGNLDITGVISGSSFDSSGNVTIGGNLTVVGDTIITGSVTGHPVISPVASDSNNSNGVVIQDLTFDEFGHTNTIGTVDLDNRYLQLSGGTLTGDVSSNSQISSTKGTIGFANLANAAFLAGTTSNGLGIDSNEIRSNGTDMYIGTISAHDINFGTGGVNSQVVIESGGKVGIGTTTPSAELDVEGSIQIKEANLSYQDNTDVDTGTEVVATLATGSYDAAFFDFVIKKTTNIRAGTVYSVHDGSGNVEFTETSTQDLGDTSDVTLSVDTSGGNLRLLATTTSNDWSVKALVRGL